MKFNLKLLYGLITLVVFLPSGDLNAHRTQGPIQGFREQYSGIPVVEKTITSGIYDIYFCAFDMGHEVHMIAYARFERTDALYQDMVRVAIQDPDGNSLTVYRDHATKVLDEPIRWEYHRIGTHNVTVELQPLKRGGLNPATVSFTMPLNREGPTSTVLITAAGIIMVTMLAVVVLKRKRQVKK